MGYYEYWFKKNRLTSDNKNIGIQTCVCQTMQHFKKLKEKSTHKALVLPMPGSAFTNFV